MRSSGQIVVLAVACSALASSPPRPCHADPIATALARIVSPPGSPPVIDGDTGPGPVRAEATLGPDRRATAVADAGEVGASSAISGAVDDGFAEALAAFRDEVTFTTDTDEAEITTSSNFRLDGRYGLTVGLFGLAHCNLTVSATVAGAGGAEGSFLAFLGPGGPGNFMMDARGVLADIPRNPSGTIEMSFAFPITVIAGRPYTLAAEVRTEARIVFGGPVDPRDLAAAFCDFGHTLSLPRAGPVFDLPPGWTANSASGRIVDNRFVPAAVPEPSTFALVVLGVVGLLGPFRRRKRP